MSKKSGEIMSRNSVFLTDKDQALLSKVNSLLEEIIETLETSENGNAMKFIKEAEKQTFMMSLAYITEPIT